MKTHHWFWGPGMCKHHLVSEATSGTAQLATVLSRAHRGAQVVTPGSALAATRGGSPLLPGKDCPGGLCVWGEGLVAGGAGECLKAPAVWPSGTPRAAAWFS